MVLKQTYTQNLLHWRSSSMIAAAASHASRVAKLMPECQHCFSINE